MSGVMSVNETDEYFPSSNKASQANPMDQITSTSCRKVEHSMNYLHEHTSCHGRSLSKTSRIGVAPAMSSYSGNGQTGYRAASATWSANPQLVCSSVWQPSHRSQAQQSLGNFTAASETTITQTTYPTLYTLSNNQSTHRVVSTHSGHPVIEHSTQCVNNPPTHSSIGNKLSTTFASPYCTSSLNSGNTSSVLPAVKNLQTKQPSKRDEPTKKRFRRNDPPCFIMSAFQFNPTPYTPFPPNTTSSHSQKPVPICQFNSTPKHKFLHSQKPVSLPTCQFNPRSSTGFPHFQRPVPDQPIPLPSKQPNREYFPFGPTEFQLTVSLDPCDGSTQNAEWMYRDTFGLEVALNPNTSSLLEHLYRPGSQLNAKFNMTLPETGRKYDISLKEMEMTDVCTGERIPLFRKTPHVQQRQTDLSNFPRLWSPQNKDIALIPMDSDTYEYQSIEDTFSRTMKGSTIAEVMRIQNKKLFIRYAFQKALLLDKNGGDEKSVNEKLLFHGTSETPPDKIWHSEDGFDLRYCRRGMWGIGSYFAENASYSDEYAYCRCRYPMFESREMIVARVLTGNSIELPSGEMSRQLVRPPVYLQAKEDSPEVLYDSVTGFTGGSRIHVLYKLDMAYPSYLIRYLV